MRRSENERLADLLAAYIAKGEDAAMEELVRRTRPRLLSAARRIGAPQDAEDSVQSAYHSLLRRGDDLGGAPVSAWLLTAVVRIAYRRKATQARQTELARRLGQPRREAGPERAAGDRDRDERIRDAVDRLPAKYRDALVLHHLLGMSTDETARLLGVPSSTVTTRLSRGRALLRSRLSPGLLGAAFFLPWLLLDITKAAASPAAAATGVVMKMNGAVLVAGVLAVGALGFGTARILAPTKNPPLAGPTIRAADPGTEIELAEARREAEALRAQIARQTAATGQAERVVEPDPAPGSPPPAGPEKTAKRAEPASTEELAERFGVDPAALAAATRAHLALGGVARGKGGEGEAPAAALRDLAGYGEEGLRALMALLRAGENGTWFTQLCRAVWVPGGEELLIEVAQDPAVHRYSLSSALGVLATADSRRSRDYLLERLGREKDSLLFMSTAQSLGKLHEEDAPRYVDERIWGASWTGVRPHIFAALSEMGGPEAIRTLTSIVRDARLLVPDRHARFQSVTAALQALGALDPEASRLEAGHILSSGPGDELRAAVEPFAR